MTFRIPCPRGRSIPRTAALTLALGALLPARISAQCAGGCAGQVAAPPLALQRELPTAAINAALGALTAGGLRVIHGKPLLRAALVGLAGGAGVYAGKRIAIERWQGAGLAGRQVAALGSSAVWNAGAGRGAVDELVFPLRPAHLYVRTVDGFRVRPKVDAAALVSAGVQAARGGARVDWRASASSGAVVFSRATVQGPQGWQGGEAAGVVTYLAPAPARGARGALQQSQVAQVLAHERVHVIQNDQAFLFWSEPAEAAVLDRAAAGRALHRWVDLGANVALLGALDAVVPYASRPWEREAYLLSGTAADGPHR